MDLQTQRLMMSSAGGIAEDPLYIDDIFKIQLYDGTGNNGGSAQTIVNDIDLAGEGGLVISKVRHQAYHWGWTDTERGVNKFLSSNDADGNTTTTGNDQGITAFNNNGFTVGLDAAPGIINYSGSGGEGDRYVTYTFRKQKKFFTIIEYTGTGSARTIDHDLKAIPGSIFIKQTNATGDWYVYHRKMQSSNPAEKVMYLNTVNEAQSSSGAFNDTEPTSSVFSVGDLGDTNGLNDTFVAYLFAHNDGDGMGGENNDKDLIKCDSYSGNTSTYPNVNLGFEPQLIIIKNTSTNSQDWLVFDSMRGIATSADAEKLKFNSNLGESAVSDFIELTSTGFQIKSTDDSVNKNGDNYIFIAVRMSDGHVGKPLEAGDHAKVFAMATGAGSSTLNYTSNFPVDFAFSKRHSHNESWYASTRIIQGKEIKINGNSAEGNWSYANFDRSDGWHSWSGHASEYTSWMWKRYGGLDVVTLDGGTSNTNRRITHNLGRAPDMIWLRKRSGTSGWRVYHSAQGREKVAYLESQNAFGSVTNGWGTSDPTATDFGINETELLSSGTWVAYLFASYTGLSSLGGYTGNSGVKTISTGFSPRFIMIRNATYTHASTNWYVYDTHRGIPAGNDNYLMFNKSEAQEGGDDIIDVSSTGFTINIDWASHNSSSYDYVYYAHA